MENQELPKPPSPEQMMRAINAVKSLTTEKPNPALQRVIYLNHQLDREYLTLQAIISERMERSDSFEESILDTRQRFLEALEKLT